MSGVVGGDWRVVSSKVEGQRSKVGWKTSFMQSLLSRMGRRKGYRRTKIAGRERVGQG